jgi:PAS domain S-box-containing protein
MIHAEQVHQNRYNILATDTAFLRLYRKTPAMLHAIGNDGRIVEVSEYWLDVMGYERHEVIGRRIVEFLTSASRQRAMVEMKPGHFGAPGENRINHVTREFVKKSGEIMDVELKSFWDYNDRGERLRSFAVLTDVTKRNRAQRALTATNRSLAATNEELERFARLTSQDLHEPLRKIVAACDELKRDLDGNLDQATSQYLDVATNSVARMHTLIEDLLRFSGLSRSSIDYNNVNLSEPLEAAIAGLEQTIGETGATIEYDDLPELDVDPGFIRQLFQNLLSNAMKYRSEQPPVIRIDAMATEIDTWIIRVADNGIGIAWEHAGHIFEAFQRLHTRREYPGTGIGLATCKRVAERHGGRIWLDRDYSGGSRFCFELPVRRADTEPTRRKGDTRS